MYLKIIFFFILTYGNLLAIELKNPQEPILSTEISNISSSISSQPNLASVSISSQPKFIHDLIESESQNIIIEAVLSDKDFFLNSSDFLLKLELESLHPDIADLEQRLYEWNLSDMDVDEENRSRIYQVNTSIYGRLIGKTAINVHISLKNENFEHKKTKEKSILISVWVKKHPKWEQYNHIFVAAIGIVISIANILIGCETDLNMVFETIKKPIAPIIGFGAQYIFMPLIAFVIARIFLVSRGLYPQALGLFVAGCAPGGGASNYWTILLNGNANLSITMTFLSTLSSFVMISLWMHLIGYEFLHGYDEAAIIEVPYRRICTSLIMFIFPLTLGVLIAKKKPNLREKAKKILRPFMTFAIVFIIVFGTLTHTYMLWLITWPLLISGFLLPLCGFMFGCFISILTCQTTPNVTAIAIEIGVQNTGVAIFLLEFSFSEPDADLSALLPVLVACLTPIPLLFGYGISRIIKSIRKGFPQAEIELREVSNATTSNNLNQVQRSPLLKDVNVLPTSELQDNIAN